MRLYVAPISDAIWHEYKTLLAAAKRRVPNAQPDGVWIVDDRGHLVAGCLFYPTPGEYMFAENMITHPGCHPRLAQQAISLIVEQLIFRCATSGKYPMVIIRHRGLRNLLRRMGFDEQPCYQMSAYPKALIGIHGPKFPRFRKEKRRPAQMAGGDTVEQASARDPKLSAKELRRKAKTAAMQQKGRP